MKLIAYIFITGLAFPLLAEEEKVSRPDLLPMFEKTLGIQNDTHIMAFQIAKTSLESQGFKVTRSELFTLKGVTTDFDYVYGLSFSNGLVTKHLTVEGQAVEQAIYIRNVTITDQSTRDFVKESAAR